MPLSATGQFSPLFLDYLNQTPAIRPFYGEFPTLDAFPRQIQQKTFSDESRAVLTDALTRQYAGTASAPDLSVLRQPNTFTVTTGHQLNIFTGPLYVVYKIVTIINLARKLNETYPDYHFVPVYWMASEDHDFVEINHFRLLGRTHTWQTGQRGAVGRMNPRELAALITTIPEKLPLFEQAYLNHDTLADAVRHYMHELFGAEGLVCLDADDPALKSLFAPVLRDELLHQRTGTLVGHTTDALNRLGYKTPISPRDINLFYLTDGLRERIVLLMKVTDSVKRKKLIIL